MNRNRYTHLVLFIFLLLKTVSIFGQISKGGTPLSITGKIATSIPSIDIRQPDWAKIRAEDKGKFANFRFAVPIDVNINPKNQGIWTDLPNGGRLWQVKIHSDNALGLAVTFADFELPEGAKLFVYSLDYKQVRGAYDAQNNTESKRFLTPIIKGADVMVEYFEPKNTRKSSSFKINRIYHAYPTGRLDASDFGESFPCEVNINCPAGADVQTQKRGVVRILIVVEGGMGWCSGSLINNTKMDGKPYVLSAFHCDDGYTPDHALWTFYFNYESPDCNTPLAEPNVLSIQGCTVRAARSATDFQLLELPQRVPANYNAYFNGWNRDSTSLTAKNTMVHHPQGDVKKVSVDNDAPIVSNVPTTWDAATTVVTPPRSHIRSIFDVGGMEPGSSGAPIFDANGRIIAQLHGGNYFECEVYFALSGWLAKSWDGGGTPQSRLKDWLDPINSGVLTLGGTVAPAETGVTIAGKVRFWNNLPMSNVKVYLGNDSTKTNATGDFSFSNVTPNVDVSFRLDKPDSYENGIDATDLLLIRRHLLSIAEFNSPYKNFCGDINGSDDIDAADILFARRIILGIITTFPNTSAWRFVTIKTSTDANFPFGVKEPSPLMVKFTGAVNNFDFYGYKKGDVDASADLGQ